MIFKYFSFDKKMKSWQDTKCYCSMCATIVSKNISADEIHVKMYNALLKSKLISMQIDNFSVKPTPSFNDCGKVYDFYLLANNKRYHFGKLIPLPNKRVANSKVNVNDYMPWSERADSVFSSYTARTFVMDPYPPPASTIAPRARRAPSINHLRIDEPAPAAPAIENHIRPLFDEVINQQEMANYEAEAQIGPYNDYYNYTYRRRDVIGDNGIYFNPPPQPPEGQHHDD